jgi:hypothetical protein
MLQKLLRCGITGAVVCASFASTAQNRQPITFGELRGTQKSTLVNAYQLLQDKSAAKKQNTTPDPRGFTSFLLHKDKVGVQLIVKEKRADYQRVLDAAGFEMTSQSEYTINGLVRPEWIGVLENLPGISAVNPIAGIGTAIGSVTTQGDRALRADFVRAVYGVTGAGVKIGVISDSYNLSGQGAQNSVTSGNLPGPGNPNGLTTPVQIVTDQGLVSRTDEGRGMLEIIHDIAPGAQLAFADAGDFSQQAFANSINALRNAGCNIIVDDVFNLGEPWFQDGLANRAIDQFSAAGGIYFTIAGNFARQSYEANFKNSGQPGVAGGATHNFAASGTDNRQRITLGAGSALIIFLHWADRYASINGAPGASSELAINIFDPTDGSFLGNSVGNNIGGDPVDVIALQNFGETPLPIDLQIEVRGGTIPPRIKYNYIPIGTITFNEFQPNSGTVNGHPNAASAITCGAADYRFTPVFGTPLTVLQPFSSAGGMTVRFNTNGQVINAVRPKPEIVATDNGNTSFFPSQAQLPNSDIEGDGFPNFPGTSAAAPHAAAVAALLKQARPTANAAQIKNWFSRACLDMDDPAFPGFQAGFDFGTGNGLLRADLAFAISGALPVFTFPTTKAAIASAATAPLISPNPVRDQLTITLPAKTTATLYRVTNSSGQLVSSGTLTNTNNRISVVGLQKGMYYIALQTGSDEPVVSSFVKE